MHGDMLRHSKDIIPFHGFSDQQADLPFEGKSKKVISLAMAARTRLEVVICEEDTSSSRKSQQATPLRCTPR